MGAFYETIPENLLQWILAQKMFWVATAPLSGNGHVNVSPKGGPCFGLIGRQTFWYLDLTGSGSETISHIYEPGNGRITIMFNAFEGPPRIVRLWGKGRVLEKGCRDFADFVDKNSVKIIPGTRSIIIVDIHQVGSSCGFSVPYYDFKEHRNILNDHLEKKEKKYKAGNEKEKLERLFRLISFLWSHSLTIVMLSFILIVRVLTNEYPLHQVLGIEEFMEHGWSPVHENCASRKSGGENCPGTQNGWSTGTQAYRHTKTATFHQCKSSTFLASDSGFVELFDGCLCYSGRR